MSCAGASQPKKAISSDIESKPKDPLITLALWAREDTVWKPADYLNFLSNVPNFGMLALKKALEILPHDSTEAVLRGQTIDAMEIASTICQSGNWFSQCPNPAEFDYHEAVIDLAKSTGATQKQITNISTIDAEGLILERVYLEAERTFTERWKNFTPRERRVVLDRIDPQGRLKDHIAMTSAAAGTVIRTLALTMGISGFSGYVAATTALSVATSAAGVTAPFYVYTSLTYAISVLSGPAGWTTGMLLTIFGVTLASRPRVKRVAAFILVMHALKLDALRAAGKNYPSRQT